MKILHLIGSSGTGGAERHLIDLCRQQAAMGLDVAVALPTRGTLGRTLQSLGIDCFFIRPGGRWNLLALWSLRQAIRRAAPDLIHAHMVKSAIMAQRAGSGVPCVATAHNLVRRCGPFRGCRRVICVSAQVRDTLTACGYPPDHSLVVPNAIDFSLLSNRPRAAERERMGWAQQPVVLCVARLVPAKGHVFLLHAMAHVWQQFPAARLVLAGEGPERAALEQLAARLQATAQVDFLGNRDDVPQLLGAADVYVQPSIKEGFGIALLEAMASALPCIATPTGAMGEMIETGHTGLLVAPGDADELAQAILKLLADAPLRQQLAAHASETVRSRYSQARQGDATLAVYRQAMQAACESR